MLSNKVALVTGSSRGIGKAIAIKFAQNGADVIVTYAKSSAPATQVADQICAMGRRAVALPVDVSDRSSVQAMVTSVKQSFNRVDILVNNAGILEQKPFMTITDHDWDAMMAVNLKGPFICAQEFLPLMEKQQGGRIINIASSGGQLGGPLAVHYSASKAGVICFTKSLARICGPTIKVNCIAPGLIETDMTTAEISSAAGKEKLKQIILQRAGLAEEVADTALFLASDQASYITGQTINVNGGLYLG